MEEQRAGTVEKIRFRNQENGWTSAVLATEEGPLAVVGSLPPLRIGDEVEVTGELVMDPRWGRQMKATSCRTVMPSTVHAIERWLVDVDGVGRATAARLCARFGVETLKVARRSPEQLLEVVDQGLADEIHRYVVAREDSAVAIVFLTGCGFNRAQAQRIVSVHGHEAVKLVKEDPYSMTAITGIGWKTVDAVGKHLGIPDSHEGRIRAGMRHVLAEAEDDGHCALTELEFINRSARLLRITADGLREQIAGAEEDGSLVLDGRLIYHPKMHETESALAANVVRLFRSKPRRGAVPNWEGFEWLDERQREAVRTVCASTVSVVTGGPGTGKTTVMIAVHSALVSSGLDVVVCAPTGKAAKRISEVTGAHASTVHRLLEYVPGRGWGRNGNYPLGADAVIVDEASMLDVRLAHRLLDAVRTGSRVVFVGDVDQLPSVGPGTVLNDLISAGIPTLELMTVHRQSEGSGIVSVSHQVNRGVVPDIRANAEDDVVWIRKAEPEAVGSTIVTIASKVARQLELDPLEDVVVLCPQKRGPAGTEALNEVLRAELVPPGPDLLGGFRQGDRVIQTKNDYVVGAFNGEIGRVVRSEEREAEKGATETVIVVDLGDREVAYNLQASRNLDFAHALTVHKSQGSEFKMVVLSLHTTHSIMLDRKLLYTGLTRAKKRAVIVGDQGGLEKAVESNRSVRRTSGLVDRLLGRRDEPEPVDVLPRDEDGDFDLLAN